MNMKIYKMKLIQMVIVAFMLIAPAIHSVAQELPEWANKLPVEKGFVFGVGRAESSDMMMVKRMAIMNAQSDLVNHYTDKFEVFASHCDTLLGADNKIRTVVTTIHSEKQAVLDNVIIQDEKMYQSKSGGYIYYVLIKMDINDQINKVKNEMEGNSELKKQMEDKGLTKELKEM
jgi:hypothetical protein